RSRAGGCGTCRPRPNPRGARPAPVEHLTDLRRDTKMLRLIRRIVVTAAATLPTLVVLMVAGLTPAAHATPIDCIVQPQPPHGACYEPVWVDGRQVTM